jgi:mediator of RNA polymerase II transcription subunit 12
VFEEQYEDEVVVNERLSLLLSWAVTPAQYGVVRPYLAAALLRTWSSMHSDKIGVRAPHDVVQDAVFDWLDASPHSTLESSALEVAALMSLLIRGSLFSYDKYVQRLLARNESGLSMTSVCHHEPFPNVAKY